MRCPSCDNDNRPGAKFCEACAAPLKAVCGSCGAALRPTAKFCDACGASVRVPAVRQPAAPPELAPATSSPAPAGERRQLTVLFCDLVGSTPLSQRLDAEEWRDVVEAYHRTAAAAVTRFGGYVAQYLGDGLLIYFGWPTAHEDDPERAIRAGLAILDAMGPLNATLAAGTQLAVRVGMHTGPVVIGAGGEVFGDTPNVAARVQGAARSGITGHLTLLAEAEAEGGMIADALATIEDALTANPDELVYRPQSLTCRGELRLTLGQRDLAETGRCDEARTLLAEIYGWFTEGFDTRDLQDAKALLEELGT